MDILKKVLFCAVLSGVVGGEILRFDNGQSVAITFLDIAVILFVGVTFFINLFQQKPLVITKVCKFAMWFVGIGIVGLLFFIPKLSYYQTIVAILYAIRFILYTVGVFLSVQLLTTNFKKQIPYFLSGVSTLLSGIGIAQYLWYPELRNLYYAGWDPHLYRVFATFLDPNFIGLFYVCGVILGIYLYFHKLKTQNSKHKIIFGFTTLLNLLALFLTYSRGAYLALLAALCIMLWRGGYKKLILLVFGGLVMIIAGIEFLSPHSEGTKLFRTASIRDRAVSLQQVTTIIMHHPFLGVGFDAYRYAQQKEGFLPTNPQTTHSGAGTDNSFLFVFATTGIVGLIVYLLMTWEVIKVSYSSKSLSGHVLFASYIALIFGSFFVNALFYPFLLVWIWVMIGVMV